ncbi:MAG: alpha/beta fold hydrolase [Phycisphaerae bacterium]|jgi:pimeloyl-ACP methyl ester carboxylesterase
MRIPAVSPETHAWTTADGYALRGRMWPPRSPGGDVGFLYLHGIQSHGGWYAWSAALLAETGCPVLLPDRRGSGMNEAARGDTPSADTWLSDIDDLAEWAQREWGVTRLGVVGVSWGGKPAVAWALRQPERVAGLLLIAPGLFPAVDLGSWAKCRVGLSLLRGGGGLFDIPLNDPALFTANPLGRQFIADDPAKIERVTARFLYFSRQLDRELRRTATATLAVPTTLLLAERDAIIRNEPTEAWLRRISRDPPQVHTFAQADHTLEFEEDVGDFETALRSWSQATAAVGISGTPPGGCNQDLPNPV